MGNCVAQFKRDKKRDSLLQNPLTFKRFIFPFSKLSMGINHRKSSVNSLLFAKEHSFRFAVRIVFIQVSWPCPAAVNNREFKSKWSQRQQNISRKSSTYFHYSFKVDLEMKMNACSAEGELF